MTTGPNVWKVGSFCTMALLMFVLTCVQGVDKARIRALVANMTVLEKARQLDMYSGQDIVTNGLLDFESIGRAWADGVGGVLHDLYPHTSHETNLLQKYIKEKTRLGIPLLFVEECLHGLAQAGHTVFPQSVALGATWDTDLVHRVGQAIGAEARAYGIGFCLSPVLGIGYEPRWGRIEELYGEDTHHVSRMAVAMVSGMQGGTDPHRSLATNHSVVAEPKHYVVHSIPESGLNTAPAHIGPRDMETIFLPTFKAAVMEGGARGLMAAYSEIDGIPNANNEYLLYEHPRKQWGFDGFVLSDLGAISMLFNTHHTAATPQEAIVQYLTAGGNMQFYDFPHADWGAAIVDAVSTGMLSESILNDRVADVLRVKMMLGLFDDPYSAPSLVPTVVNSKKHQELALEAARKAITLLKNDHNTLPLEKAKIRSIALIGPSADKLQLGDYSGGGVMENRISTLDGISRKVPQAKIYHAWGSGVLRDDETQVIRSRHLFSTFKPDLNGVVGEYFNNTNFQGTPVVLTTHLEVDFDWFLWAPFPKMPKTFSARWVSLLVPDTTVVGSIGVACDSGSARLTVDGEVVVDTFAQPHGPKVVPFAFQEGKNYTVVLEFVRDQGCTSLSLVWSLVGGTAAGQALAIKAATAADVIIAVVGEDTSTCGEGLDRDTLDLPGSQQQLLEAVRAAAPNKPFIAVLLHGRPLSVNWLDQHADAIITGFYPGQAQGTAIADVLFGDYNPAGRIPVTFPKHVGQLPMFYNAKPSARKNQEGGYVGSRGSDPLYHFGFGLSYTRFVYENLKISPSSIPPSGKAQVSFDVTNVGDRPGEEVAQLYVRDQVSSVTTPTQSLKGFTRFVLKPKEKRTITFTLDAPKDLALYNRQYKWVVEPGDFTIMVGPSSNNNPLRGQLTVTS